MLRRAVGLDETDIEIEFASRDRRAEIDGQRQRIAGPLRMLDQRAQDRGRGRAAELADKGVVILAALALPGGVTGNDPGCVVENMWGFGQHEDPSNLYSGPVPKSKFNCLFGLTVFSATPEVFFRIVRDPDTCQRARNSRQSNHTDVANQISEEPLDGRDLILAR